MASDVTPLTCDDCGFDAARWSPEDLRRTLAHTDDLLDHVLDGAPQEVRDAFLPRSGPTTSDPVDATHALMHDLARAARHRATVDPFEPMIGTVESLQASPGVPKSPVAEATVGTRGMAGDRQRNRTHHGRPWQALCLYSADVIDALRAEGHPIVAGGAGENLTLRGIDWSRMRGGLSIEIGDTRALTSSPTTPCSKVAHNFADRLWGRIDHADHPGWSRWYASVVTGGVVRAGDVVTITA